MAGEDDDWDREFEAEEAPTRVDQAPVPEAIPETATTGRYRTLHGFEVAAAVEVAEGRARLEERERVLQALRLAMIQGGSHPDAARLQVDRLRAWMAQPENEELVRVACLLPPPRGR